MCARTTTPVLRMDGQSVAVICTANAVFVSHTSRRDPFFIRKVVYAIDLLGDPASVMALVRTRFMTLHGQGASQVN